MPAMRWPTALLLVAALAAGEMPPSPAEVPGERVWAPPAFTHWPGIAYRDERRNAAVSLPVRQRGAAAAWGWEGAPPTALLLPDDAERTSGLVSLDLAPGTRRLHVRLPEAEHLLPLRVVPVTADPWPCAGLVDGHPVDAAGVPVVLLADRPMPGRDRIWELLRRRLPRPEGRPLLVGDPLAALGDSPWNGLDADTRPAVDPVRPHHACLIALATLPRPLPRTLVWCPGNGAIRSGEPDPEEVRLLGAVRERCAALGAMPVLVLALPPQPAELGLRPAHDRRREALIGEADRTGWRILDLARAAGEADRANRIGDQTFAPHPAGEALARVREALRGALAR